jgi:23S rRNA-/tRNA-specific pseudouridylate synthase
VREVYRDRWLVVIDKPSGLPSQAGRDGRPGVYERLLETEPYVGLHHRLDTPASGLLLLSLHRKANAALAEGFREHQIARNYRVWVLGDPGEEGAWEAPLDGRRALTRWARLRGGRTSELRVSLETGRTHQIRRHATEAGHPVLGDRRHGGAAGSLWARLALHAEELALKHPITGEALRVLAELPADLAGL